MKLGRRCAFGLVALFALALASASSASVGPPEYGRCLKQTTKLLVELRGCETNKGKCGSTSSSSGIINTAPLAGTLGVDSEQAGFSMIAILTNEEKVEASTIN